MYYQSFLLETLPCFAFPQPTDFMSQPSKLVPFRLLILLFECLCVVLKSVCPNPRSLYFFPNCLFLFRLMKANPIHQVLMSRIILDYSFTFIPQNQCVSKYYFLFLLSKYIQILTIITSSTAIFLFVCFLV